MKVLNKINEFTIREGRHGFIVTNTLIHNGGGHGKCMLSTYDRCIEVINHVINKTIPEKIHPYMKSCILELSTDPLYISKLESTKAHLTAKGGRQNG